MSERRIELTPSQQSAEGFEQAENGLYVPAGFENTVNPQESALNNAMQIGMEEEGLGSIKYEKQDLAEEAESAYEEILDPRNVIELKQLIDNKVDKLNTEQSHLGDTKSGEKQLREDKTKDRVRSSLVEDYLHVGDPEGKREIVDDVRSELSAMLSKSYEELEELGNKRTAKENESVVSTDKKTSNGDKEHDVNSSTPKAIGPGEISDQAVNDQSSSTKVEKTEMVITDDIDEAKAYWESHIKEQGIPLEDYLMSEGAWLVERTRASEVPEDKDPTSPKPEAPRVPKPPTKPQEPSESDWRPPTDEKEGKRPEKPKRKLRTKIGRIALAALAFIPAGGYIAGRLHENYIVKSHDTPSVDEINKFQDHVRSAPEEVQENIANDYETAREFFDEKTGISTDVGQENFKNLEQAYEEAKAKFKEKHPNSPEHRVEEMARRDVEARLNAQRIASLEDSAKNTTDRDELLRDNDN